MLNHYLLWNYERVYLWKYKIWNPILNGNVYTIDPRFQGLMYYIIKVNLEWLNKTVDMAGGREAIFFVAVKDGNFSFRIRTVIVRVKENKQYSINGSWLWLSKYLWSISLCCYNPYSAPHTHACIFYKFVLIQRSVSNALDWHDILCDNFTQLPTKSDLAQMNSWYWRNQQL